MTRRRTRLLPRRCELKSSCICVSESFGADNFFSFFRWRVGKVVRGLRPARSS